MEYSHLHSSAITDLDKAVKSVHSSSIYVEHLRRNGCVGCELKDMKVLAFSFPDVFTLFRDSPEMLQNILSNLDVPGGGGGTIIV